jgi:hypothetical protein
MFQPEINKSVPFLYFGNRLSITPVDPRDWEIILGLLA